MAVQRATLPEAWDELARLTARVKAFIVQRQGVFQITPRNSTEISDYGMNDVSAVDKDITAVVRVTFSLEN